MNYGLVRKYFNTFFTLLISGPCVDQVNYQRRILIQPGSFGYWFGYNPLQESSGRFYTHGDYDIDPMFHPLMLEERRTEKLVSIQQVCIDGQAILTREQILESVERSGKSELVLNKAFALIPGEGILRDSVSHEGTGVPLCTSFSRISGLEQEFEMMNISGDQLMSADFGSHTLPTLSDPSFSYWLPESFSAERVTVDEVRKAFDQGLPALLEHAEKTSMTDVKFRELLSRVIGDWSCENKRLVSALDLRSCTLRRRKMVDIVAERSLLKSVKIRAQMAAGRILSFDDMAMVMLMGHTEESVRDYRKKNMPSDATEPARLARVQEPSFGGIYGVDVTRRGDRVLVMADMVRQLERRERFKQLKRYRQGYGLHPGPPPGKEFMENWDCDDFKYEDLKGMFQAPYYDPHPEIIDLTTQESDIELEQIACFPSFALPECTPVYHPVTGESTVVPLFQLTVAGYDRQIMLEQRAIRNIKDSNPEQYRTAQMARARIRLDSLELQRAMQDCTHAVRYPLNRVDWLSLDRAVYIRETRLNLLRHQDIVARFQSDTLNRMVTELSILGAEEKVHQSRLKLMMEEVERRCKESYRKRSMDAFRGSLSTMMKKRLPQLQMLITRKEALEQHVKDTGEEVRLTDRSFYEPFLGAGCSQFLRWDFHQSGEVISWGHNEFRRLLKDATELSDSVNQDTLNEVVDSLDASLDRVVHSIDEYKRETLTKARDSVLAAIGIKSTSQGLQLAASSSDEPGSTADDIKAVTENTKRMVFNQMCEYIAAQLNEAITKEKREAEEKLEKVGAKKKSSKANKKHKPKSSAKKTKSSPEGAAHGEWSSKDPEIITRLEDLRNVSRTGPARPSVHRTQEEIMEAIQRVQQSDVPRPVSDKKVAAAFDTPAMQTDDEHLSDLETQVRKRGLQGAPAEPSTSARPSRVSAGRVAYEEAPSDVESITGDVTEPQPGPSQPVLGTPAPNLAAFQTAMRAEFLAGDPVSSKFMLSPSKWRRTERKSEKFLSPTPVVPDPGQPVPAAPVEDPETEDVEMEGVEETEGEAFVTASESQLEDPSAEGESTLVDLSTVSHVSTQSVFPPRSREEEEEVFGESEDSMPPLEDEDDVSRQRTLRSALQSQLTATGMSPRTVVSHRNLALPAPVQRQASAQIEANKSFEEKARESQAKEAEVVQTYGLGTLGGVDRKVHILEPADAPGYPQAAVVDAAGSLKDAPTMQMEAQLRMSPGKSEREEEAARANQEALRVIAELEYTRAREKEQLIQAAIEDRREQCKVLEVKRKPAKLTPEHAKMFATLVARCEDIRTFVRKNSPEEWLPTHGLVHSVEGRIALVCAIERYHNDILDGQEDTSAMGLLKNQRYRELLIAYEKRLLSEVVVALQNRFTKVIEVQDECSRYKSHIQSLKRLLPLMPDTDVPNWLYTASDSLTLPKVYGVKLSIVARPRSWLTTLAGFGPRQGCPVLVRVDEQLPLSTIIHSIGDVKVVLRSAVSGVTHTEDSVKAPSVIDFMGLPLLPRSTLSPDRNFSFREERERMQVITGTASVVDEEEGETAMVVDESGKTALPVIPSPDSPVIAEASAMPTFHEGFAHSDPSSDEDDQDRFKPQGTEVGTVQQIKPLKPNLLVDLTDSPTPGGLVGVEVSGVPIPGTSPAASANTILLVRYFSPS